MFSSNMSKIEELRLYVNERLHAAAVDILGVIEKTITDYEDQASLLKRETDRQRNLLDIVLRPKLPENGQFTTTATTTHQSETGSMNRPFQVENPSPSCEPQCAFTSREEFLKFAAIGNCCPYCCKETEASEMHLIKRHYFFAIHFTDKGIEKFTVPCTCKERIKGRSHWHCPDCGKTIYRKNNFEVHLSNQHGHLLQQQSRDADNYQPSVSFCEEDGQSEQWLWPEFSSLGQEEHDSSPLAQIKEEQEQLWIGLEGREFQVHPEWHCKKSPEVLEKLQIKEEQTEWCNQELGGPSRGLEVGGLENDAWRTVPYMKPLDQDSTLASALRQVNEVESTETDAFPATSMMPMEAQLDGQANGIMQPAGDWQQPPVDCSLVENENSSDSQKESSGGGAWSGLKTLKSKRAKHVKTNCSYASLKWKWPVKFSMGARGPHRCKICGKAFYCMLTLMKHAQTHTQDKPCVCVVCGKHLESRECLAQHLQVHKENVNTF